MSSIGSGVSEDNFCLSKTSCCRFLVRFKCITIFTGWPRFSSWICQQSGRSKWNCRRLAMQRWRCLCCGENHHFTSLRVRFKQTSSQCWQTYRHGKKTNVILSFVFHWQSSRLLLASWLMHDNSSALLVTKLNSTNTTTECRFQWKYVFHRTKDTDKSFSFILVLGWSSGDVHACLHSLRLCSTIWLFCSLGFVREWRTTIVRCRTIRCDLRKWMIAKTSEIHVLPSSSRVIMVLLLAKPNKQPRLK